MAGSPRSIARSLRPPSRRPLRAASIYKSLCPADRCLRKMREKTVIAPCQMERSCLPWIPLASGLYAEAYVDGGLFDTGLTR